MSKQRWAAFCRRRNRGVPDCAGRQKRAGHDRVRSDRPMGRPGHKGRVRGTWVDMDKGQRVRGRWVDMGKREE